MNLFVEQQLNAAFFQVFVLAIGLAGAIVVCRFESRKTRRDDGFEIRFGIIKNFDSGEYDVSRETTSIPLFLQDTGFVFGYSIDPPDARVYWTREVLRLPAAPRYVGFSMTLEHCSSGALIHTPNVERIGPMVYPYSFTEGDPLGPWVLEVYINDELAREIRFRVISPERSGLWFD